MKRPFTVAVVSISMMGVLLAAEGPGKKPQSVEPPWQRLLQGADAKKAAEQESRVSQLQEAGHFAEALKVAQALAELRAKAQGAEHWEALNARFAVEALRHVLRAKKEEQHSYRGALVLNRAAYSLAAKGHNFEAQPLYDQVLSIRRKVLGEEHPDTATSYSWAADNLSALGKYKEAEEGFGKALTIRRKVLGEEHPDTAASYGALAYNLYAQGKYKEAEECYRRALAIYRKVLGEEHPHTATIYSALASDLHEQGVMVHGSV
jgi:tetratricopeptide (TPR) repeat protein